MNKVKLIRNKHIYIKVGSALLLVLASLLLAFAIMKESSPLLMAGSILLEIVAGIFFVLSLLTKTIKYKVGDRVFYLCIGIFFHFLTSRRHILDKAVTVWFGIHSLYYEFDKFEIEGKIGTFKKPLFTVNDKTVKGTK